MHANEAPRDGDRAAVLANLLGETVAAIEANEESLSEADPAVARALARIAEDEARHAALAWRTVAWMVERGGENTRRNVLRQMRAARKQASASHDLFEHVIAPTLAAILGDGDSAIPFRARA
jgi:hypothetical protein